MMNKSFALAAALLSLTASAAMAADYTGNAGTGFGGPIGLGALNLTDNGTTITGTLTKGTGGLNDAFVIYLDTTPGGLSDTSTYTDTGGGGDYLRKAISGFNGAQRATVVFPSGFSPDYAIALSPSSNATFGGLWSLADPTNFAFVSTVNLTPNNSTSNASYTFGFDFSSIGLTSANSFNFVTTYLDANGAYRSNESIGSVLAGTPADAGLNFGQNAATALNFQTYAGSAAVPEPATLSLLAGPAFLAGYFFLRRRRRA